MDRVREWLTDKRNLPIVIAGVAVLIVGAALMLWQPWAAKPQAATGMPMMPTGPGMGMGMGPNGMPGPGVPGQPPGLGVPGTRLEIPVSGGPKGIPQMPPGMGPGASMPTGMPGVGAPPAGMPGMPPAGGMPGVGGMGMGPGQMGMGPNPMGGAATTPPQAVAAAPVKPIEAWRADPFQPIGYKKPPKSKAGKGVIRIAKFPQKITSYPWEWVSSARPRPTPPVSKEPTFTPQPYRRMAGILMNGRVFAIIETNGQYDIVKPGDMLTDKLATVEKIMRDRVILKSTDPKPRYMTVYLTGAPMGTTGTGGNMPGGGMMGPGGMPNGPMGPGGMMGPGGAMGPGGMMGPGGAMGPGGMMPGGPMGPGGPPMPMGPGNM